MWARSGFEERTGRGEECAKDRKVQGVIMKSVKISMKSVTVVRKIGRRERLLKI